MLICFPQEMVVVSTIREPGVAGFAEEEMVQELIPTLPRGTVVEVVLDEVLDEVLVVVVIETGAIVDVVVVEVVLVVEVVVVLLVDVVVAAVSIVTLLASALNNGPEFPAASDIELVASRAITVPSDVQVTLTVMVVPELVLGAKVQLLAVPLALLKSPDAIPLTDSLNASV
jgi:hypothetical protein